MQDILWIILPANLWWMVWPDWSYNFSSAWLKQCVKSVPIIVAIKYYCIIFKQCSRPRAGRSARSTLLLDDLIPSLGALFKRMLKQGADSWKILHQCKKAMDKHSVICEICLQIWYYNWKNTWWACMSFVVI